MDDENQVDTWRQALAVVSLNDGGGGTADLLGIKWSAIFSNKCPKIDGTGCHHGKLIRLQRVSNASNLSSDGVTTLNQPFANAVPVECVIFCIIEFAVLGSFSAVGCCTDGDDGFARKVSSLL